MILGVDVGGTKTLFALFDDNAKTPDKIVLRKKIPTPDTYQIFCEEILSFVEESKIKVSVASFAIPGPISKDNRSVPVLGNKTWENLSIVNDFEKLLHCSVVIHNDAKLGGLSEAISGAGKDSLVNVYISLSTGIGIGVIVDRKIEPEMSRDEVGMMPFEKNGKLVAWEEFASARAFNKRFNMKVSEAKSYEIWDEYAQDVALGLSHIVSTINTDVVVIGGPVGEYFSRLKEPLLHHLHKALSVKKQLTPVPKIVAAKYPNDCVIRGCFYAAKQVTK